MAATSMINSGAIHLQHTSQFHTTPSKSISEPDNGLKNNSDKELDLSKESERLKTYKNWPNKEITAETLAAAGFYYINHSDAVRCAFCGAEGHQWQTGDNPLADHMEWSPDCIFVKNKHTDHHSGISLLPLEESNNLDVCGNLGYIPNSLPEALRKVAVEQTKPCSYPAFTTFDSRLESFTDWPKSMKQKPAKLAEAGFFYKGVGDQTLCFNCGGGLKDWEDNDDPWEQHALWFSKCSFLLLSKGPEFVEEVKNKDKAEKPSFSASNLPTKEEPTESSEVKSEQSTKNTKEVNNSILCKICYKNEVGALLLPCGHIVSCVECVLSLKNTCPVCRKKFEYSVRAFVS